MSRIAELRQKSAEELRDMLGDLQRERFNMRFQAANGALENTARVRQVRRDIARVKTLMAVRETAASGKQE